MEGIYVPGSCFYYFREGKIIKDDDLKNLFLCDEKDLLWINLNNPTDDEIKMVEEVLNVNIQEPEEIEEIESTSRFINKGYYWILNTYILMEKEESLEPCSVSIIWKDNFLITFRNGDLPVFKSIGQKIKANGSTIRNGKDLFFLLYETRIDLDADFVEIIAKDVANFIKISNTPRADYRRALKGCARLIEISLLYRDMLEDAEKGLYSLLRTNFFTADEKEKASRFISDISSIMEYLSFLITRLEYLQNFLIGMINLELGDVVKIFTVVTVLLLPPTLIASIYGMNLTYLPLAQERWAFGFFIAIMIVMIVLPSIFFRRKGWL